MVNGFLRNLGVVFSYAESLQRLPNAVAIGQAGENRVLDVDTPWSKQVWL